MEHALELARKGQGRVEPNPCVGAVIVNSDSQIVGEGWHEQFGGPHAEVNALRQAGDKTQGATLYVTLEPCNHHGKTPPCTEAVIAAGIQRVVIAISDPAGHGAGSGVERLRAAGIEVTLGVCEQAAKSLIAPFETLASLGRPYLHAKWAMTLDGRIATRSGHSKWISGEHSRARVHELRGRMDGILTGIGTVLADDPLLTARPAGPRTAVRIVLDSRARIPLNSELVRTARLSPVVIVTTDCADVEKCQSLQQAGVELLRLNSSPPPTSLRCDIPALLDELGRRQLTNVLLEAGGELLGGFHDRQLIDEVHCFIAPKLAGGMSARSPIAGVGRAEIPTEADLISPRVELLGDDIYINGRIRRT